MKLFCLYLLSTLSLAALDPATLPLHSPDWHERRAAVEILGKLDTPQAAALLLAAMHDPQSEVADAACTSFWETARPYTPEMMEDMLKILPNVPVITQRKIVQNIPVIVSIVLASQKPAPNALPQPPKLPPEDLAIIYPLYMTEDTQLLKTMLTDYFFFNGLKLPEERLLRWISMPDEISTRALLISPMWVKSDALIKALSDRWENASDAWKLQSVQMPWGAQEYSTWLAQHTGEHGVVGEMAKLTLQMRKPSVAGMADLRKELTLPLTIQRWAQLLPALGKNGMPLAVNEIKPNEPVTVDILNFWAIYQTPLPEKIALDLLSDNRRVVREVAGSYIAKPDTGHIRQWCRSEWPDVRALGIRFGAPDEVEILLVDENSEVRAAAVIRWITQNWPNTEKVLNYGLDDDLIQDAVLLAAVRLPQLDDPLSLWANTNNQKVKLEHAKTLAKPATHIVPLQPR